MVDTSKAEKAKLAVMVFERSIAITTVTMADRVMINLLNHEVHWRRKCHCPQGPANRALPFFCGGLRCASPLQNVRCADGGDRTHTHLRELDFESSASANSATSAFVKRELFKPFSPKRKREDSRGRLRMRDKPNTQA
jgi:hypothetical protein